MDYRWPARRPRSTCSSDGGRVGRRRGYRSHCADFRAGGTERFALEADVTRPWIVEAVESVPAGGVADWTLDPQAGLAERLAIRLGQGISPAKPLRLVITARWSFYPLQKLGVDDLAALRIRNATDEKRLVAVARPNPTP